MLIETDLDADDPLVKALEEIAQNCGCELLGMYDDEHGRSTLTLHLMGQPGSFYVGVNRTGQRMPVQPMMANLRRLAVAIIQTCPHVVKLIPDEERIREEEEAEASSQASAEEAGHSPTPH